MNIKLEKWPTGEDWMTVKQAALVTVGKHAINPPDDHWKHQMLVARHSPIRELGFRFLLEGVPYCTSVHLVRHHVGFQPYVRSQRNDWQDGYDRNAARQDAPVDMIWTMNAEALMILANKRLCHQAALETRALVRAMCALVEEKCPEFKGVLVPMCEYHGNVCHEMRPCGRSPYDWMEG